MLGCSVNRREREVVVEPVCLRGASFGILVRRLISTILNEEAVPGWGDLPVYSGRPEAGHSVTH